MAGAGGNLRLGFSAGSTTPPNQAELQAKVRPGVQAEALRRQLVQSQGEGTGEGEGEGDGAGPAAIRRRFLQRDSSLPDVQVSRPLVDARALSKLSRLSGSDPTLLEGSAPNSPDKEAPAGHTSPSPPPFLAEAGLAPPAPPRGAPGRLWAALGGSGRLWAAR